MWNYRSAASWLVLFAWVLSAAGCLVDRSGTRRAGLDASSLDAGSLDSGSGRSDGGEDAGLRFDAGPIELVDASLLDAGFDASLPDAGFDASLPDAGFDASLPDAGSDASVVAEPPTCDAIYAGVQGYLACAQTSTRCRFRTFLGTGRSCRSTCEAVGQTCLAAYGNLFNTCSIGGGADDCNRRPIDLDSVCVCSRNPL